MEDSDIVNHAKDIMTHISEAIGSLHSALDLLEGSPEPTPVELYLLARLDIAVDILRVELPPEETEAIGFQVEG